MHGISWFIDNKTNFPLVVFLSTPQENFESIEVKILMEIKLSYE